MGLDLRELPMGLQLSVVLTAIASLPLVYVSERAISDQRRDALLASEQRARHFALFVADRSAQALLDGDDLLLADWARQLVKRKDIAYARFTRSDDRIAAEAVRPETAPIPIPDRSGVDDESSGVDWHRGRALLDVAVPVRAFGSVPPLAELAPGASLPAVLGELRVGLDATRVSNAAGEFASTLRLAAGAAALLMLLGFSLAIRVLLQPLDRLTQTALRISGGDLDSALPRVRSVEARALSAALSALTDRLAEYRAELASQKARIPAQPPAAAPPSPNPGRDKDVPDHFAPEDEVATSTEGSGVRVLLVDDNLMNRSVAIEMLRKLGCSIRWAPDGQVALRAMEEHSFDLVLMDVQMPNLDGLSATRQIRQREAQRGSPAIPIVAVTAHVLPEDKSDCFDAGMNDYISKPFTRQDLANAVDRWCGGRATGSEASTAEATANTKQTAGSDVVDFTALAEIGRATQAGSGFLTTLVETFLSRSDEIRRQVEDGLASGNRAQIAAAAHEIASSSAQLGARELPAIAKELEAAGRDRTSDLVEVGQRFLESLDAAREAFAAHTLGADLDA